MQKRFKLATTGKLEAPETAPIVLRGSYEEIISQAADIGYDAVELHIHDSLELNRGELMSLLNKNDITLSSIGTGSAYADGISLSHPEKDRRETAIERLRQHIITAKDYGSVVIIGLIKGLIRDCNGNRDVFFDNLTDSLHKLITIAEELSVTLVMEVINRYESDNLNTIEEMAEYIDSIGSPNLMIHIDTFHMNIEEPDISDSIRRAGSLIGHCHIADSDRWYAGHGHYDFMDTINALSYADYKGYLSVESLNYPDPEISARMSYKYLSELFGVLYS